MFWLARPVVGAHFRREEEDARASRTFSTAVATKDKDSTLPADMQGLPGGGLTSGATILLASHNMPEVERVCDDVVMMRTGRIVDRGAPRVLLDRYGRETLEDVFLDIARDRRREAAAQ